MRKLLYVCLFILLLLLSACTQKEVSQNVQTDTDENLTLVEAIKLAYSDALKWDEDAKLLDATSMNNEKEVDLMDGKSRYWDITFGIPATYEPLLVNIRDGKIYDHTDITDESSMPLLETHYITNLSEVKFDSPELLKKAIKNKKLYPSDSWQEGYIYRTSMNAEENMILVQIVGWDKDEEKMKALQFNASTGELLD